MVMTSWRAVMGGLAILLCLGLSAGCEPSANVTTAESEDHVHDGHDHHDHDHHGHDHDGHDDHGGHDHDGHHHDGHDHDAHDHDGHDHDGHDHDDSVIDAAAAGLTADDLVMPDESFRPESFGEAVEKLAEMRTAIAKGFADDDVDSIHDQLHEIGNLLEATLDLIDESDLAESKKEQANEAVEALFDAFGGVDAKLHGDSGQDYDDVSESINQAITSLQDLK